MVALARKEGWEVRFNQVIEEARHTPYQLGVSDCLRLACRSIEVISGVDFWPRFEGYKTHRQALVTIARIAPTLGEAVSKVLEQDPIGVAYARRGDVVLYRDSIPQDHLGVVTGSAIALLEEHGLQMVPLSDPGALFAWRIG